MARGSAGQSALHRQIRVLSSFDALRPYRTLSDLARTTGMAPSTLHRIIDDLVRENLVERMPDRSYRLGLKLWELAARVPGAPGLRDVSRPWLAAAHSRVRQHVQLGVRAGTDVLFIDRLSQSGAVVNVTLIGGRLPLYASSGGLVLLAHASEEVLDAVVAAGLNPYTPNTPRTRAQLETILSGVRSDGFAVADGFIHEAARGIAVPVFGPDRSAYAALGVVIPNDGSPALPHVEVLSIAARGIERELKSTYASERTEIRAGLQSGVSEESWTYIERLHLLGRQDL